MLWICFHQLLAISTQSVHVSLVLVFPHLQQMFYRTLLLSLAKGFSCMHLISKTHTISHQLTFSCLFCISSFWLFQHPIYLKISCHIPLWILSKSLWNELHAFEQIMESHSQTLKTKDAWFLYVFIHRVRMYHLEWVLPSCVDRNPSTTQTKAAFTTGWLDFHKAMNTSASSACSPLCFIVLQLSC